jgi:N-terminal acetyltransferase B complex non-catalytic subunit
MENYFSQFGDKACCFEDLQPYVDLGADAKSRWTSFLQSQEPSFVRTIIFVWVYCVLNSLVT